MQACVRVFLTAVTSVFFIMPLGAAEKLAPVSDEEAAEIAVDAYLYAYPLVLMEVSRQAMTNVATATAEQAPVNQFNHKKAFPNASFTDVVRPNADTLYSSLWFDVKKEPLVIEVPDSGGRYYLLPVLDMWTDVFASPGKRTTGTLAYKVAIVGPKWEGKLPDGVALIRAPTSSGWLIGRTQTNGAADYDNVHKFQAGLKAVPLSSFNKEYKVEPEKVDPNVPKGAPVEIVAKMDAGAFFARFAEITKDNPPHANDYPILEQMERMGLKPGRPFELAKTSPAIKSAFEKAPAAAWAKLKSYSPDKVVNGWSMIMNPIGTYGTDYLKRALVAYMGLGANVVEDAIYPTARVMEDGTPFDSAKKYVLNFKKNEIPPARAFWSLTMYNDRQFFADNSINRYAIGDRDQLNFGNDGSLTLYVQRDSPGKDKEANWLPAPRQGSFTMNLRLYWPKAAALDGSWRPPAVKRAE